MGTTFYLEIFKNAADKINKGTLARKGLEVATGLYGDSVFLKLYKQSWANQAESESKIKTMESKISELKGDFIPSNEIKTIVDNAINTLAKIDIIYCKSYN